MTDPHPIRFVLASASSRRQQLLRQIGLDPVCMPMSVDEHLVDDELPGTLVERLARTKAKRCLQQLVESDAASRSETLVVLGADTVIDLDGEILGKPRDESDALAMLLRLAEREHSVLTGVCVLQARPDADLRSAQQRETCVRTRVRFGPVTQRQARAYWESGEPADKAGGYAIQGMGAQFVAHLSGSYSNVVGLPLYESYRLLQWAGLAANHPA